MLDRQLWVRSLNISEINSDIEIPAQFASSPDISHTTSEIPSRSELYSRNEDFEIIYGVDKLISLMAILQLLLCKNIRKKKLLFNIGFLLVLVSLSKVEAASSVLKPVEWVWLSGASNSNQPGVAGASGQFSSGLVPGARQSTAMTTTAYNGYIYIFGGHGYPTAGGAGVLGDVWVYRQTCWSCKGEWAWLGGKSDSTDYQGYYAGSTPYPGSRYGVLAWFTPPNQFHVHGGYGKDGVPNTAAVLSDLWRFNTDTYAWTWLKGSSVVNQVAAYGTKDTPAAGNVPGAVYGHRLLTSKSDGAAIMFGGNGYDSTTVGDLSDAWKYSNGTTWTWISGPGATGQNSVGGLPAVFHSTYFPGARSASAAMDTTRTTDLVYLFGGKGRSSTKFGYLADLWAFNTVTNEWAYIVGESSAVSVSALGSYGSLGSFSASNHPGSRWYTTGSSDPNSDLIMLFGGEKKNIEYFNDYWAFNVSTRQWSWASGDSVVDQNGNYADSVWFSSSNKPGGRQQHTASVNNDLGLMYLFGGQNPSSQYLNDFWATKGPTVVVEAMPTSTPAVSPTPTPTADPFATSSPTALPTSNPTALPTASPTTSPTMLPTTSPTTSPTITPSPTTSPTVSPSMGPTTSPTITPSPTTSPTISPSMGPTILPTSTPVVNPTPIPGGSSGVGSLFGTDDTTGYIIIGGIALGAIVLVALVTRKLTNKNKKKSKGSDYDDVEFGLKQWGGVVSEDGVGKKHGVV